MPRLALVIFVASLAVRMPAAQVTIFSPFNLPGGRPGMCASTTNIPYADGDRKRSSTSTARRRSRAAPAPVVMFIYGGGWAAGDKFEYEFVGRAFAANGFVTVIPDYRKFPEVELPGLPLRQRPGDQVDRGQHRELRRRHDALLPRRTLGGRLQRGDARARSVVPARVRRHHADPRRSPASRGPTTSIRSSTTRCATRSARRPIPRARSRSIS